MYFLVIFCVILRIGREGFIYYIDILEKCFENIIFCICGENFVICE